MLTGSPAGHPTRPVVRTDRCSGLSSVRGAVQQVNPLVGLIGAQLLPHQEARKPGAVQVTLTPALTAARPPMESAELWCG